VAGSPPFYGAPMDLGTHASSHPLLGRSLESRDASLFSFQGIGSSFQIVTL
jgi:hypothetical protein